ncbi:MAG TPA: DUF4232 domain-containing protein [Mycobacterium sp.]|nr:DUF4232 domain-containing protein [Mycobacterium sp.]
MASRKVATLGLLAAAALVVPLTAAPMTASAGLAATTVAPRCVTSHLEVWLGIPGEGAAGSTYYQMEFTNVGPSACTLRGFPGVSAWTNGHMVGSPATWLTTKPATVTLQRGATAHAVLRVTNVGVYPASTCKPVTATVLKVYPPNNTVAAFIPYQIRGCSVASKGYLNMWRPVVPGVGIPQH